MNKKLMVMALFGLLAAYSHGSAQTSLTAAIGTPVLDGVASPGEWTSDMITTSRGLTVKAMIDDNNFYVLTTWDDATSTENIGKNQWSFDGASWSQSGDEDRVGIVWDMGQNGTEGANCASMCHVPAMNTETGKVDVWHWKAARSNPMGFVDDKNWLPDGRHGDEGSGIDKKNSPVGSGFPGFMAKSDPDANMSFLLRGLDALNGFDPFGVLSGTADTTVAFDSTITFATGATIPGRTLGLPTEHRASVRAAGKYDNGTWTVEFSRAQVSDEDDFEVVPGGSVEFTTEVFDNEGSSHFASGFDATVYTMNFPMTGQVTSLTAGVGAPTLDGVESAGEWTSDMITTSEGLTVKAMVDDSDLYVLAKWLDKTATENVGKNQWSFDGGAWSQSGDEDRVGFVWDMGQNGAEGAKCATMCHIPDMKTETGKVDVWHWKAARSNPLGFTDDKFWFTDGRHGDEGSGIDSKNSPVGSGFPSLMAATDPDANVSFLLKNLNALSGFDPFGVLSGTADTTVAFDSTITFATGATIPGRTLGLPTGNRASVRSAGKYDNGMWTVEFKRSLGGDADDFKVISQGSVEFTTEIFDNEGSAHWTNGFDATVYTLNFPMITSVGSDPGELTPKTYVLQQNFPNPFNPSTTIAFNIAKAGKVALKIYNLMGQEVATLVNGNLAAGSHKIDFNAANLSSGIYIYRLSINGFTDMKKMAFVK